MARWGHARDDRGSTWRRRGEFWGEAKSVVRVPCEFFATSSWRVLRRRSGEEWPRDTEKFRLNSHGMLTCNPVLFSEPNRVLLLSYGGPTNSPASALRNCTIRVTYRGTINQGREAWASLRAVGPECEGHFGEWRRLRQDFPKDGVRGMRALFEIFVNQGDCFRLIREVSSFWTCVLKAKGRFEKC